jgi:two-component system, OmpR family, response regulator
MEVNEKLIFFVDDDKMILNLLEYTIKNRLNYNVKSFLSGEECLANLSKNPSLIVLDHYFSKLGDNALTGLETLDKIKLISPKTPVIILSSQEDKDLIPLYFSKGASRYISKDDYFIDSLMEAIDEELIK